MVDMSKTIAPKSDQLNADDLISGDRVITVTRVQGLDDAQQPVAVYYEGSSKPYKPCKSMRRVMVKAWGADASKYAGRSMRIFCDPEVQFGGMKVGGIRISHMSHIERDMQMALTASKTKRAPYLVRVLQQQQPKSEMSGSAALSLINSSQNLEALKQNWSKISPNWATFTEAEQEEIMRAKDAKKTSLEVEPEFEE